MRTLMREVVLRRLAGAETVILTPRRRHYSSLALCRLERLASDLDAAESLIVPGDQLIIDLAAIEHIGSGFIRVLYAWIASRSDRPIVCGDRTGMLSLCGADRWLTIRDDLAAALDMVACC